VEASPSPPGTRGAVSVSPVSYDPASGVVFVASRHAPSIQTRVKVPNVPGGPALFKTVSKPVPASIDQLKRQLTTCRNGSIVSRRIESLRRNGESWGPLIALCE
jgi:hypothetical protein